MNLKNKVIVVTGGASGFGLGITLKLVEDGAKVIVVDINQAAYDDNVVPAISDAESVLFIKADITKESEWESILSTALSKFGKLDVVVNNAGTTYPNKSTLTVTEQDFDKVFAVNVKGIYFSFNVIVPYFQKNGGGSFIQISSTAALRPRPGLTWYNATKGAVSTASKSMAIEFGKDNIRFNCICPVAGDTPLLGKFMGIEDLPPDQAAKRRQIFIDSIPLGRLSKPSDIANSVAFLASDEAEFLTGLDLEVDGGRCI